MSGSGSGKPHRHSGKRSVRFSNSPFTLGENLIEAIEADDPAEALRLIGAGADVTVAADDGSEALHHACYRGMEEVALRLVEAGADVNAAPGRRKYTPLMLAAAEGMDRVIDTLLGAGADVHAVARDGNTALLAACLMDKECAALTLIHAGADVNAKSLVGETPLKAALAQDLVSVAALLQSKGATKTGLRPGARRRSYGGKSRGKSRLTYGTASPLRGRRITKRIARRLAR